MIIIANGFSMDSKLEPVTIFFEKEEIQDCLEQIVNFGSIRSIPRILLEQEKNQ